MYSTKVLFNGIGMSQFKCISSNTDHLRAFNTINLNLFRMLYDEKWRNCWSNVKNHFIKPSETTLGWFWHSGHFQVITGYYAEVSLSLLGVPQSKKPRQKSYDPEHWTVKFYIRWPQRRGWDERDLEVWLWRWSQPIESVLKTHNTILTSMTMPAQQWHRLWFWCP